MPHDLRRLRGAAVAASLTLLGFNSTVHAQNSEHGPRWQAFFGCWGVTGKGTAQDSELADRLVCITPTADADVADISAIDDDRLVNRERIDASGRSSAIDKDGCKGTQRARWSRDERRIYLRSSVDCGSGPREISAILALTSSGTWIDVRRVSARAGDTLSANVRVARYADVGLPKDVPDSIADQLRVRGMSISVGRIAAAAPLDAGAIVEAVRATDPAMAEAWVAESGELFSISSHDARALSDSGVSPRVIDALYASGETGRMFAEWPRWDGVRTNDVWDQGTGMRKAIPETGSTLVYDPWGNGVWFYAPRARLAQYGFTMGAVDGEGFEYLPIASSLFGYKTTVTGYVKPPVAVLHADPSQAGESTAITKGDGSVAREVPEGVADAVMKAASKSDAARSASPTERNAPSKSGARTFP